MASPLNLDVQAASTLQSNPFAGGGSGMFGPQSFSFGGSGANASATASATSSTLGKYTPWIVAAAVVVGVVFFVKHRK
jgi:hypothetical protein